MNIRAACILGMLALAFGSASLAQTETSTIGTVVSSSSTSLVIRTDGGAEQTFDVDSSSTIPAGLMAGNRVTVNYHVLDTGRRHAASVTLGEMPLDTAPVTTPETTPVAPTTIPDTAPAPEPMPPAEPATDGQLPETASELPLLALAGLMTIAAGFVLRELRRRDA